jgi:hypothetical protein
VEAVEAVEARAEQQDQLDMVVEEAEAVIEHSDLCWPKIYLLRYQ